MSRLESLKALSELNILFFGWLNVVWSSPSTPKLVIYTNGIIMDLFRCQGDCRRNIYTFFYTKPYHCHPEAHNGTLLSL